MFSKKVVIAASALAALSCTSANAFERGFPGWQQKPGVTLGAGSAGTPPPGIYASITGLTYQAQLEGPATSTPPLSFNGLPTKTSVSSGTGTIVFVPGWSFLGAQYSAVISQPMLQATVLAPVGVYPGTAAAVANDLHNTLIIPIELSWKLGDSGFFVKTGLGVYVPDGAQNGPTGLLSIGNPWWTYQPELIVSYLKDGWNFTANTFMEINTRNSLTDYQSGNVLHAEFTATKTIGAWTVGPVAYYAGQVSDDRASRTGFYTGPLAATNMNRYNIWAVGGKVGYNFGPATLNVWGLREVHSDATCGGTCLTTAINNGWTAYVSVAFRLWAPEAPVAPGPKLVRK